MYFQIKVACNQDVLVTQENALEQLFPTWGNLVFKGR